MRIFHLIPKKKTKQTKQCETHAIVFGVTAFQSDGEMGPYPLGSMPNDGEMGPYPLSSSMMPPDGEMGPYPLSDNTNLLGPSSYGAVLYRNYGSNYDTRYTATATAKNLCTARNCQEYSQQSCNESCDDRYQSNCYRSQCNGRTRSKSKQNTPVPTRRNGGSHERDSFRRHSMHGRMSSQGILNKPYSASLDEFIFRLIPQSV